MAEDVIVRYRAEVDELTSKLNLVAQRLDKVEKEAVGSAKGMDSASKSADKLDKELAGVGKSADKAGKELKDVAKSSGSEFSKLGAGIGNVAGVIGAGLVAAFSIDAVKQYAQASINAFLEAQENAEKLRFAITQIGGEGEAAFQRLIDQSERLQKSTIFSDDAVQQAQTVLSTFGLTSNQIEELIPKLADFASVTKQDIVSAANAVGQGLQGMGREFKKFGIEVSANNTELENLTAITEGFAFATGAAAAETETLAGQLKQQANAADELQEELGEKLAPVFVRLRIAIFEATLGLLGFNKAAEDLKQNTIDAIATDAEQSAERIRKAGGDVIAEFEKILQRSTETQEKQVAKLKELQTRYEEFKTQLAGQPGSGQILAGLEAEIQAQIHIVELQKEKIKQAEFTLDREKQAQKETARTLSAELLRGKSINELNTLLIENGKLNDAISKSNIDLINKELAARKKLADQLKKDDERTPTNERVSFIRSITTEVEEPEKPKPLTLFEQREKDFTDFLNKQNQERVDSTQQANQEQEDSYTSLIDSILGRYEQEINAALNLSAQLTELSNTLTQSRIDNLTREKEALNTALDQENEALTTQREKRLISEKDYQDRSNKIAERRIDAEKKIDREIRRIRKQQAIISKANALFEIAINTARGIVEALATGNIPLSILIGALGAAQAATVVATPIPAFKKGTKGKKGSGMALVGEEGPEAVFLPDQAKVLPAKPTKVYSQIIDAMFDNTLDSFILDRYVAPALIQQKKQYDKNQGDTFAQNIVNNMTSSGVTYYDLLAANKKGVNMNNTEQLAAAIAQALNQSGGNLWRG